MIDQIRREIEAAFADVPMPKIDAGNTGEFAQALKGREWTRLNAKFLKEWWPSYDTLNPEFYRYYLPALLTVSIDELLQGRDSLIGSALFQFQYQSEGCGQEFGGGSDELGHERQTSLFSKEQYKAVCSFLEIGFDLSRYQKFAAAAALVQLWNRYEHPAIDRARAFYREMHTYEYPASVDAEINALIRQIRAAFDKTPPPSWPGWSEMPVTEQVGFFGADWKTLHPDFVSNYDECLTHFGTEQFRYYLPAYMIADLMIPEIEGAWSNVNVVFHLTDGFVRLFDAENDAKLRAAMTENTSKYGAKYLSYEALLADKRSWAERQLYLFNQQEREIIIQFLRYKNRDETGSRKSHIDLVLERYWLKPIRQEIEDAFAAVPIPEASQLIEETVDHPGAQALVQALAGLPRTSLDADFLRNWQPFFRYLTPEAYRYYFLALPLYNLEPDYVELCATGRDATHQHQTSLFDERQYKAACASLELKLADQQFEMAAAFVHRWNRYEHPALDRARAFYQKMHNFECPASDDEKVNEVIRQIRQAFDATPYPDDTICEPLDAPEAARAAIEFRGTDWRTLHPSFVASYMGEAALPFFTDKAFRYFLPAYLIADLMVWEREHEWVESDLTRHLTQGLAKETYEDDGQVFRKAAQKFSNFSQPERDAIVSYLRYQMKIWPRVEIKSALRYYWLKPVQQFRDEEQGGGK